MTRKGLMPALVLAISFTTIQGAAAQHTTHVTAEAPASHGALTEDQKIDLLLNSVRAMKHATCIRNGSQYEPADAAAHLEMKREKHADKIKTAEAFIEHLATKSSMSGEYYTVKFSDGTEVRLGDMLKSELKKIEAQH